MSRVFISYRRDDSADVTGRIFDRLRLHFEQKSVVFRDVDNIPFGRDFRDVIKEAVESCEVLLAVIGPTWVDIRNEDGERRLDDPNDFVRLEIEAALKRKIPVIPLLVNRAGMPKDVQLPDSLQQLAFRHGCEIRHDPDFHRDMNRLIRELTKMLVKSPSKVANKARQKQVSRKSKEKAENEAKAKDPLNLERNRTPGEKITLKLSGDVPISFAWCPPGTFQMGGNNVDNEKPVRTVKLTKGFYLGIHPVTQAQWKAVMGISQWGESAKLCPNCGAKYAVTLKDVGRKLKCKKCSTNLVVSDFGLIIDTPAPVDCRPVDNISWMDALEFCAALMEKLSLEGRGQFRLPREAEWEYACRAGTTTDYYTGNGEVALKAAGWYFGNSGKETHPVGQLVPNLWNLHDMHGNVWEWCSDWYGDYSSSQTTDPNGPVSGTLRVNRGGAWDSPTEDCRSACRGRYFPVARNSNLGFRVALVLKD